MPSFPPSWGLPEFPKKGEEGQMSSVTLLPSDLISSVSQYSHIFSEQLRLDKSSVMRAQVLSGLKAKLDCF